MTNEWNKVEIEHKEYENYDRADLTEIGDSVEGTLVSKFVAKYGDAFVLELDEDTAKVVYPNHDLQQKLEQLDFDMKVKITFVEEKDVGQIKPMKVFEVLYKKD